MGPWLAWLETLAHIREGMLKLASVCQDMSQKVKGEMELESCYQSNFKNGVRLFLHMSYGGNARM